MLNYRSKRYVMKAHGGVDVQIHVYLTSALVGGEWLASRPCHFTPGERGLGNYWIEGWVDSRDGLDDMKWTLLTPPGPELLFLDSPARNQ
jgi:hypothetical protein